MWLLEATIRSLSDPCYFFTQQYTKRWKNMFIITDNSYGSAVNISSLCHGQQNQSFHLFCSINTSEADLVSKKCISGVFTPHQRQDPFSVLIKKQKAHELNYNCICFQHTKNLMHCSRLQHRTFKMLQLSLNGISTKTPNKQRI